MEKKLTLQTVSSLTNFKQMPLYARALLVSLAGWLLYLLYAMAYCELYLSYIERANSTLAGSLKWALVEYGPWYFITPVLLVFFSLFWQKNKVFVSLLALFMACLVIVYRVALDMHENPQAGLATSLVTYTPTHITTLAFIVLGWAVLLGPQTTVNQRNGEQSGARCDNQNLQKLAVQTGTRELDIPISEIESISAAGNYVEVFNGENYYILRATMKQLEDKLKTYSFVRVHRSYLINSKLIRTINSDQTLTLLSGKVVPAGRKYQRNIQLNQQFA